MSQRSKRLEAFHQRVERYSKNLLREEGIDASEMYQRFFSGQALVIHGELSVFLYRNAFIVTDGNYIGVIAEHHDIQCWMKDDLWHFHADLVRQLAPESKWPTID